MRVEAEVKQITHAIRMAARNFQTALAAALDGHYSRAGDEACALIREALQASGDSSSDGELLIRRPAHRPKMHCRAGSALRPAQPGQGLLSGAPTSSCATSLSLIQPLRDPHLLCLCPEPAAVAGNYSVPSTRPAWFTTAATCLSAWVSTPPMTGRPASAILGMSSPSRSACQRRSVRGVTIRDSRPRRAADDCRARAARTARPAWDGRGELIWRCRSHLVAELEDLGVLVVVGAGQQGQPAAQLHEDQVKQAEGHES